MSVHQTDPYKVGEIRSLGNDAEAKQILERVASQVQPILRKRQFTVPLLAEFFPRNPCLLGINVGGGGGSTMEINLRLRPASNEHSFMPYESILKTMLHEMTHNVHGPHNAAFYKLMDDLVAECEDLMARGISGTGAGFDARAAGKVGGKRPANDSGTAFDRRTAALKAAEARAKKLAIMPSGAVKLGGDRTLQTLCNPREAAALAAERRLQDNMWCPTERLFQEKTRSKGGAPNAALQAILSNVGLHASTATGADRGTTSKSEQQEPKQHRQHLGGVSLPPGSSRHASPTAPAAPTAVLKKDKEQPRKQQQDAEEDVVDLTTVEDEYGTASLAAPSRSSGDWTCPVCTLTNRAMVLQCDACLHIRPEGYTYTTIVT